MAERGFASARPGAAGMEGRAGSVREGGFEGVIHGRGFYQNDPAGAKRADKPLDGRRPLA